MLGRLGPAFLSRGVCTHQRQSQCRARTRSKAYRFDLQASLFFARIADCTCVFTLRRSATCQRLASVIARVGRLDALSKLSSGVWVPHDECCLHALMTHIARNRLVHDGVCCTPGGSPPFRHVSLGRRGLVHRDADFSSRVSLRCPIGSPSFAIVVTW